MSQGAPSGSATHGRPGAGRDELRERLRLLLHRVELAGQYQRAARARQLGLHQVELAALEHLVVLGGLTPGELGHRLGLTSGGVTALAGRLIDAGHVVRRQHLSDRRMRILTATEAGERHVAEYIDPLLAQADRAIGWLSSEDSDVLERFLDLLAPLKERGAAATPGPPTERAAEPYRSALLM
jgi:DNA-binding MarR family transcriptional regulator